MLDEDTVASTDNVSVVRSAPHGEIIPQAATVVTHCGHGTTMKALASGVPLVCMPMGRDQNDNAARVVEQGAGVRLSPKASAEKIREAVEQVLRDERYRAGARRMASIIEREQRSSDVVAELESVVRASGRPSLVRESA